MIAPSFHPSAVAPDRRGKTPALRAVALRPGTQQRKEGVRSLRLQMQQSPQELVCSGPAAAQGYIWWRSIGRQQEA
jgi:hypothetical protein